MPYNPNFPQAGELNPELAYDLRQVYAKIVGDHLQDIAIARKADNYFIYYKALRDLFVVTSHKFKNKKVVNKETGKEENEFDKYGELIQAVVTLANQYSAAWLGQGKDPKECSEIEEALQQVEMFLYGKIEDAKMFGGSSKIPGL